jgi:5-methylcytosine-specific restriction endonuclease McrA
MSGIKGMNLGNTNGFKKGQVSYNKGKTKAAGLYPETWGFQKGHKSYSYKGMNKGQIPWNKGKLILIDRICLECNKEFRIRKDQVKRGRGLYCSKECYHKAKTVYELSPGRRFIHHLRQTEEYKNWRINCLRRDWFRCQECFTKDNLEVHHIKSFTELVIEFLNKYNMFSPIEDTETLIRLASGVQGLWDINNGKTLCEFHHKSLTMKSRMELKWQK